MDPNVMGGRPCVRCMRVTVGMIVGMLAVGHPQERTLELYSYLEPEDIQAALEYAAWRTQEFETPIPTG